MANTYTAQVLVDGPVNAVIKFKVDGDNSGQDTAATLYDVSTLSGAPAKVKLMRVWSQLNSFSLDLLWDATTDVPFLTLPDGWMKEDYRSFGGLQNNAGVGVTGDIMVSSKGLADEEGSFTLWLRKT
jgi:hypothetical protein